MAELATIARPYAEALFKSSAAGDSDWVAELGAIAANPQLQQLADNPRVTADQVYGVITGVAKSPLPEQGRNFLRTLLDNGRLAALPEIAAQYRLLRNQQGGTSDATVYSAFPMDEAALAQIKPALEKRFGRKLNLSAQEQPDLIGGVRIVVGDEVLDTSVRARLEQMKAALAA